MLPQGAFHTCTHMSTWAHTLTPLRVRCCYFWLLKKSRKPTAFLKLPSQLTLARIHRTFLFILTHDIKYAANKDLNWAVSKIFPLSLIRKVYDTAEKKTRMNCVRGENLQFLFIWTSSLLCFYSFSSVASSANPFIPSFQWTGCLWSSLYKSQERGGLPYSTWEDFVSSPLFLHQAPQQKCF